MSWHIGSMLSYRKKLAYELIENVYIKREEIQEQLGRSPKMIKVLVGRNRPWVGVSTTQQKI